MTNSLIDLLIEALSARGVRVALLAGLLLLFGVSFARAQEEFMPVPKEFTTEGVPAIAKADVAGLLFDPKSVRNNLLWDADTSRRRLLVTDVTNGAYLLEKPMNAPRLTAEKVIPAMAKFRPGHDEYAYLSDIRDEDNQELYLHDLKTGTARLLVGVTAKEETINAFVWDGAGRELYYVRVDYEKNASRLCRHDLTAENCFGIELKGNWEVLAYESDKVLLKFWNSSSNQQLFAFDVRSGKNDPIEVEGNNRRAGLSGGRVYWANEGGPRCPGNPCVLFRNLVGSAAEIERLPIEVTSIQDLKLSPTGKYVSVLEIRDGLDSLHVYGLKGGRVFKEMRPFVGSNFVVWHSRWLGTDEIAYTVEHVGKPASIRSFNFKSGKTTAWTTDGLPSNLAGKVAPPQPIRWKSFDGREISGFVLRPASAAAGPLPVVVFVHGGPQILDRPTFSPNELALISNLGVAVIHTNIRGSSGMGREFMDADNQEKRGAAVDDVRSLLDWIATQKDLDAKRVALRGQSYGGFVVLAAGMAEPDKVCGILAEYPLVSIRGLVNMSWAGASLYAEYGDPKDEGLMKKLDALSPLNNASRWNSNIPVFLTRGKRDERNPEKDIIDLKNQLKDKGADVWFLYSSEAGHGVGGDYVDAALFSFLKKHLLKGERK